MGADVAAEEQFGPYLVYERLGVGGMATVHRALERGIEGFERVVALKRLLPHLAADASFIKSFVREAKLASILNHVNIVQIFELGRVGTQYFISMEHIDGRDIRRILRHARKASGPPPIHVTVGMLLQLCDALDYAHHKVDDTGHPLGLVHRDVSPSNVLVTNAGQVKVIDFGIAKAQSAQLRTQTGRVKGKLAYMAPEALAGKDLDARSDLFAVGVIGHELLTARPLFATKNEYQTLMKVQRGDIVPPSTFHQGCPPELDTIVLRALARDPDDRFRHASDLRDALHALRKQYNLQTTNRDIATWIDWAFSLEVPAGGFAHDHAHSALETRATPRNRPSRPKRSEEDEVVDLAWGGGEEHNSGDPVVLDDVPDVTDKHLTNASSLGADVRLDLDDLVDDIPTPAPSHGVRPPPISSRTVTTPLRPPRTRQPTPAVTIRTSEPVPAQTPRDRSEPVRTSQPVPAQTPRSRSASARISQSIPVQVPPDRSESVRTATRSAQDDIATPNVGVGVRSVMIPPRIRKITIPPLAAPSVSSQRTVPSLAPPPPVPSPPGEDFNGPTPAPGVASSPPSRSAPVTSPPPRTAPATSPPPRTAPATSPPPERRASSPDVSSATARTDNLPTERNLAFAHQGTPRPDTGTTDRTPAFSLDELGLPSDTMPSLPAMRNSEPVVRFRAPTNPPADGPPGSAFAPTPTPTPTPAFAPTPTPTSTPAPASPTRPGSEILRLITPATALFAEPDPEADADADDKSPEASDTVEAAPRPSSSLAAAPEAAPPRRTSLRRALVLALVLVLLGAASALVAQYLTKGRDATTAIEPHVPPTPTRTLGTVRFVIVPEDSSITIAGKPMHAGSPWDVDLPPGTHQIEIHHDGYKDRLTSIDLAKGETQTLRLVLDRLDSVVVADASGSPATAPTDHADGAPTTNGSAAPPVPDQPPPASPPPPSAQPPPAPPASVSPTAVSKLAGRPPRVTKLPGAELPSTISAKICIDDTGQVTASTVLSELAPRTAAEIEDALHAWRYAPYKVHGVARAACFVESVRVL